MTRWRALVTALQRVLLRRAQRDRDLDDEIRFHLEEEARVGATRGLTPAEALQTARKWFGSVTLARESTRAIWVSQTIEQLAQDIRFGSRILTRSPGVSATAVLLVALVIGGNTTVFSIAHGILSRPAPGVHGERLMTVSWVADDGQIETHNEYQVYAHFVEHSATLRPVAAFDFQRLTLSSDAGSFAVRTGIVSPNYFDTLGVRLFRGRSFIAADAGGGEHDLPAVISHQLWKGTFQGRDDILGHPIALNGLPATIVGITDPEFHGALFAEAADLWTPLSGERRERLQPDRTGVSVFMIGRLVTNVTRPQVQAELATLWTGLQRADPDLNRRLKPRVVPYSATAGGNSAVAMYGNHILAIFSVVTLLTVAIVCANVANLLIARAALRQREMALRQSLGASRGRIVRSLIAEGLVLSVVAWLTACVFAWWVSKAVAVYLIPMVGGPVLITNLTLDWVVVGYALALALLCTMAFTIGPALREWRRDLLPHLKAGEQGVVQARSPLSRGLVVVQLAFSVLLLTTAGFAYRSLALADGLNPGFRTSQLLLATVNTAGSAADRVANAALVDALADGIRRLPGVDGTAFVPGRRLSGWRDLQVRLTAADEALMATDNRVSPGFFQALGVPFVAGRDFGPQDTLDRSVIVSRSLAETLWPGESAIGRTLVAGPLDRLLEAEVVGVVRDAHVALGGSGGDFGINTLPRYLFFPTTGRPAAVGETTFYIRHGGPQELIAPAVGRALQRVDARVPIADLRSLESQIAVDQSPLRLVALMLSLFAAGSLLIAAIGQYAVVAFDGRRRIREFGLRIALGASARQVVRSVVGESFRLTAIGLVIGFALSLTVGAVLSRFLFGITPTDPPTYATVFLLLTGASLLACYLPARRAARTDPMIALRTE